MKKRWLWVLLLAALLAGFVWQQNFTLQVDPVELSFSALPEEFDGLRVAQLSDLHGRSFGRGNCRLLQCLARAQPDLICISGDLFDEKTDLAMLEPLLTGLVKIAPVYYVTGNHEWQVPGLSSVLRRMRDWGVTVLQNDYVLLRRGAAELAVAGVDDPCGPADAKPPAQLVTELHAAHPEDFILMLSHRNDELPLWSGLNVPLVLSGHCHGGVVRLPFLGGIFGTHRELLPEYDAGAFREGNTVVYVSRGLGYTNVHFRLFNRPHVPILILRSEKNVNKS